MSTHRIAGAAARPPALHFHNVCTSLHRNAGRFLPALLAVLILGGCAAPPPDSFAPPSSAVTGGYRLRPGDAVLLEVFQEPYLTTRQRILSDGTISVGLIGRVNIAGETARSAADKIAALLNEKQLVNPQVNLSVESYTPRRFVVWGQVRSPGSYVIPGEEELTLPQAIAMAGGNSDIGDPRRVSITRREDGTTRKFQMNALSPQADHFFIREGDIIRVAETLF